MRTLAGTTFFWTSSDEEESEDELDSCFLVFPMLKCDVQGLC